MKKTLTALWIAVSAIFAFGHEGIEIGPNGGRILEFSKNETMHGEVIAKDEKLHIVVLDKDMKPVKVDAQTLSVTSGSRANPVKLDVEVEENAFVIDAPNAGDWVILQFKESADAKTITARMHYNTKECAPCKSPEWLCKCG